MAPSGFSNDEFNLRYRELESRMKHLAESDGDVFLPNPEPWGQVDHVFICMEPSLGRWASSKEVAVAKVEAGFRNFVFSVEDFILHFCVQEYLCLASETYHLTDISKGAMLVKMAGLDRRIRYRRWLGLLLDEIDLVAKENARIFAVGGSVEKTLFENSFMRPFRRIIHYSGQAAKARSEGIIGLEAAFEEFKESVCIDRVIGAARSVLEKSKMPLDMQSAVLSKLVKSNLSESRKKLMFNYKCAFESARQQWVTATDR